MSNIAITEKKGKQLLRKIIYTVPVPGAFPDKVTTDIDFIEEAVVQCDDLMVKTSKLR